MVLSARPSTMRRPRPVRRRIVAGVLAATVAVTVTGLTACSSDDGGDGGGNSSDAATADGETRTVTDFEGNEVEVSSDPQTVVTLHFAAVQALLDLGIVPAGQNGEPNHSLLTDEQYEEVKDVPDIGSSGDVNVEAIADLEPDLILVPNMIDEDVVAQLREIAPSYIYVHSGEDRADWSGRVRQIADAVNRTDEYEALQERLGERQREIADRYGDLAADRRIAFFSAYDEQEFTAMGSGSMAGEIITPAGAVFADGIEDATRDADGWEQEMSTERLSGTLGDADVIFYATQLDGSTDPILDDVMETATFGDLDAARNGDVYPLGKGTVAGYTDAFDVLDRYDAALAEIDDRR